jgi:spore coat protein U-like protein
MPHIAHKLALAAFLAALATSVAAADRCTVSTAPVAFGSYDPFAGARDASGGISLDCNGKAPTVVQLGAGGSGNASDRQMTSGGEVLRYNVYGDAARTQVFTWLSTAGTRTIPLYGRIFSGQPVAPGTYTDMLVVTVLF